MTVSEKNCFGSMASGSEGTDKKPGYLISETTDFVNGVDLSVDVLDIHFSRQWSTAECPGDRTESELPSAYIDDPMRARETALWGASPTSVAGRNISSKELRSYGLAYHPNG